MQNRNGSFGFGGTGLDSYSHGTTSLVVLALLTSGMPADNPVVADGLEFLRKSHDPQGAYETYQTSLIIMAMAAAKQPEKDRIRITRLARTLEELQCTKGDNAGMWNYGHGARRRLRRQQQYAVRHSRHFARRPPPASRSDAGLGNWPPSISSTRRTGTAAGDITTAMRQHGKHDLLGDRLACDLRADAQFLRGRHQSRRDSQVLQPGAAYRTWLCAAASPGSRGISPSASIPDTAGAGCSYYLYGVERAGRLSGQRFFGPHDWYREGAGVSHRRADRSRRKLECIVYCDRDAIKVVATSFALLFLSKGLAPVLINKLNYGPLQNARNGDDAALPNWNLHPNDVRNLTEHISGLPRWPKLLTYQELDLRKVVEHGSIRDLLQAPILYISGLDDPKFTDAEVQLLRAYVEQGGFIFAVNNCNGAGFDEGIRKLASQIYPSAEARRPSNACPPNIRFSARNFRSIRRGPSCWGSSSVAARRSSILPRTIRACGTSGRSSRSPSGRPSSTRCCCVRCGWGSTWWLMRRAASPTTSSTRRRKTRKVPGGTRSSEGCCKLPSCGTRGTGTRRRGPCKNVLIALNRTSGLLASTRQRNLVPSDPNLFRYPLAYLHGRSTFQFSPQEIQSLRKYLDAGAVLFADACCGSPQFDQSFREMVQQLYPQPETGADSDHARAVFPGDRVRHPQGQTADSGERQPDRPARPDLAGGGAVSRGDRGQGTLLRDLQQVRHQLCAGAAGLGRLRRLRPPRRGPHRREYRPLRPAAGHLVRREDQVNVQRACRLPFPQKPQKGLEGEHAGKICGS